MGYVDKWPPRMQGRFFLEVNGVIIRNQKIIRNKQIGISARGCQITGPNHDPPPPAHDGVMVRPTVGVPPKWHEL